MTQKKNLIFLLALICTTQFFGCSSQSNTTQEATSPVAAEGKPSAETAASDLSQTAPITQSQEVGVGQGKMFYVYSDASSPDNHFSPSGWMGDYGDLKINDKFMDNPHGGSTSIQIQYSNKASQGARWAGIYWQNPPNNWGTRPGGFNLTGATKLTFWIRGDKGGERVEEIKVGGIGGDYADTDTAGIGPVELTTEWKQYTIDLTGRNLSSISGGFCWAANLDGNPDGFTFYLDDIRYE